MIGIKLLVQRLVDGNSHGDSGADHGIETVCFDCCETICRGQIAPCPMGAGEEKLLYWFSASLTATATATVAPTMGLLPMPRKPIIST